MLISGPAPGGDQFDFVESVPAWASQSTTTLTANTAYFSLVRVGRPITVSQMTYAVGAAAGTVDLGIYTFDGTNFVRQASTGPTTAAGTNTNQTINLTASYTMRPGVDYWFAYLPSDGATQTAGRTASTIPAPFKRRAVSKAAGSATLPATLSASGAAGAGVVWMVAA